MCVWCRWPDAYGVAVGKVKQLCGCSPRPSWAEAKTEAAVSARVRKCPADRAGNGVLLLLPILSNSHVSISDIEAWASYTKHS